jgi:hypothetical protein
MPGCGIRKRDVLGLLSFSRRFLPSGYFAREGQGEREIDVLVGVAARAVFSDTDHDSFKTGFAFMATVPDDKFPDVIF